MSDRAAIAAIHRVTQSGVQTDQDLVAVEAPLTVHIRHAGDPASRRSLGLLMRTPGHDEELVLGLLHGEGLIRARSDVVALQLVRVLMDGRTDPIETMEVDVSAAVDLASIGARAQHATSACGLCGRLAIQSIDAAGAAVALDEPRLSAPVLFALPQTLRAGQSVFAETGGLHAAGLFDLDGVCLAVREDVGRHNAVDKIVGWALTTGRVPARRHILVVSGRVAFEIVQKAAIAGVSVIAAVGAPSSLAVEAARAARITLVGFVRDGRFNVYAGAERLR